MEVRVHDPFGELGVVGHQQEAGGVEVETADGDDEAVDVLDEVIDRRAAIGVLVGGDVAGGLIEKNVEAVLAFEGLAVEADFVALHIDPVVRVFDDLAVHLDAAFVDPAARVGARAEAGF